MPGYKIRSGSARGVRGGSLTPRGSMRGGVGLSQFRVTRSGVRSPRVRARLPQMGSPRVHLGGGIVIHPRLHFVTFDRNIIKSNWSAINRTPLQAAANLIRIIARRSIKRRKSRTPSTPGTPPFSHYPGKTPPFKQIFNYPYRLGSSQIIGMVGYPRLGPPVPWLHEHGGRANRRVINKARYARSQPRNSRGQYTKYNLPKFIKRNVKYPQRPFMVPALQAARGKLSRFWVNSLRRKAYIGRGSRRL
jgi:hypothetical protein